MSSKNYKLPDFFLAVILISLAVWQQNCSGGTKSDLLKARIDGIKKIHKFSEWAGETKMVGRKIDKLIIDEEFFKTFSKETRIYTKKSKREKELSLKILDIATGLDVSIDIGVCYSPRVAHELMIRGIAMATAPPPVYKRADPNDPNDPLNIGDVCFGPAKPWIPAKCEKPVLRSLMFCRNNVLVHLRNSFPKDTKNYPDLRKIALLIDEKLKALSKLKSPNKNRE
jgi:hypothetical protein